jgi:hypothetical protein
MKYKQFLKLKNKANELLARAREDYGFESSSLPLYNEGITMLSQKMQRQIRDNDLIYIDNVSYLENKLDYYNSIKNIIAVEYTRCMQDDSFVIDMIANEYYHKTKQNMLDTLVACDIDYDFKKINDVYEIQARDNRINELINVAISAEQCYECESYIRREDLWNYNLIRIAIEDVIRYNEPDQIDHIIESQEYICNDCLQLGVGNEEIIITDEDAKQCTADRALFY